MKKLIFLIEEFRIRPLVEMMVTLGFPIATVSLSALFAFVGKYI